ncbi:winged helix-turn-helix transcriptional regulator [Planotetraspora kaengkrachanensis]|uniref:Transcriptional regulator n=1 Tax=Planotetraspora kaengkrachanensis TaxID=575193 RepID=A0A8J3PY31_9ACTN|nr:helix-turn-helix domain-containing protein [Planotetraspora kaengkrachanensis]GIG83153.1 transcriptional regulator [Planotetraspora kaengkrachanensis]
MQRTSFSGAECPMAASLDQVGDWWSMLILRDAFDGYSRFDEFERSLGIAPNMLTRRLKALVAAGVLSRRPYQQRPVRYEYVLTERGRRFLPVLLALSTWGDELRADGERPVIVVDSETGREIDPVLVDRKTGEPITASGVRFAAGPGAGEGMRGRYAGVPGRVAALAGRASEPAES